MKDIHTLITEVESTWPTSTNEQREDLIKKLRNAESTLDATDEVTRTHIGGLIHQIQASEHSHDKEFVVPPLSQGSGFSFGSTLPTRFDTPER